MVAIGKKVLGLLLLVCIAAWPLGCLTVNKDDNAPKKEVIIEKAPEPEHRTEVNVKNN